MKILFVTDLHANRHLFEATLEAARHHRVQAVVVGGDLLEWGLDDLEATEATQRAFLQQFLDPHLGAYDEAGIHWIAVLSSHDLPAIDGTFDAVCAAHTHAHHISRRRLALNGFEFIGFDLVADYPFSPKSRCRREDQAFHPMPFRGKLIEATPEGWRPLEDWAARLQSLPTLEEELAGLPAPHDERQAVYVIHHPPAGLGLGVIKSGADIGSRAVRRFLERVQPRLSLHGHIHESPATSGKWATALGRTLCIQPGQGDNLHHVLLDLPTLTGRLLGAGEGLPEALPKIMP
ncbi:MAG: phosphoesterase [Candidatus Riflebacteria bacterium]|nr:phosphoesterase [Candidatus Riflebacteria bacterium]